MEQELVIRRILGFAEKGIRATGQAAPNAGGKTPEQYLGDVIMYAWQLPQGSAVHGEMFALIGPEGIKADSALFQAIKGICEKHVKKNPGQEPGR